MLVKKGKRTYLYRSFREDGGVRTTYHGPLNQGQIRAHQAQKAEQDLRKQQYHQMTALLVDLDAVRAVHDVIIRAGLLVNHQYFRRSEIRTIHHD